LSPTMEPPVARVSAARATPSWEKLGAGSMTYVEDDAANGGAGLHGLDSGSDLRLRHHGCVAQAVVVVEPAQVLLKRVDVAEFHCKFG